MENQAKPMNFIKQLIYDIRIRNSNEEIKRIYNEAKKNGVKKIGNEIMINGCGITLGYEIVDNTYDPYRFFYYKNYAGVEIENGYSTLKKYVIELAN